MYSGSGKLLYVGKAKNLKNRVRSYFQKQGKHDHPKLTALVAQVDRLDFIIAESEEEALMLESNLIKAHHPKYNVLLKDDKRYPWLCLTAEPFPRLILTRTPRRSGGKKTKQARYFGPYTNVGDLHQMLRMIRKHFPLRQRRKPLFTSRPCMNYSIGSCLGPCQDLVTEQDYDALVRQVTLFLKGKTNVLLTEIDAEMEAASEVLNFEWAAKLRDRRQAVENVVLTQRVMSNNSLDDWDVIAFAADEIRCVMNVLPVREGKLVGNQVFEVSLANHTKPIEAYEAFLAQFYEGKEAEDIPDKVVLQHPVVESGLITSWLSGVKGKKVELVSPGRGQKKDLVAMAAANAQQALEQSKLYEATRIQSDPAKALLELQEYLNLPDYPSRMECYDISHIQGRYTVASMVVFTDGRPDNQAYRRFKIHTAEGAPDDFKSMAEVMQRRFKHSGSSGKGAEDSKGENAPIERWEDPDLVIIDGGKGQLSSAVAALKESGVENPPMISLAKKFEEIFVPGQSRPIVLSKDSQALKLLQQIRDEAHRFAITYHRTRRAKGAKASALDRIPGIGPKRKKKLMDGFGSIAKLKEANVSEIVKVAGIPEVQAQQVYDVLHLPSKI